MMAPKTPLHDADAGLQHLRGDVGQVLLQPLRDRVDVLLVDDRRELVLQAQEPVLRAAVVHPGDDAVDQLGGLVDGDRARSPRSGRRRRR